MDRPRLGEVGVKIEARVRGEAAPDVGPGKPLSLPDLAEERLVAREVGAELGRQNAPRPLAVEEVDDDEHAKDADREDTHRRAEEKDQQHDAASDAVHGQESRLGYPEPRRRPDQQGGGPGEEQRRPRCAARTGALENLVKTPAGEQRHGEAEDDQGPARCPEPAARGHPEHQREERRVRSKGIEHRRDAGRGDGQRGGPRPPEGEPDDGQQQGQRPGVRLASEVGAGRGAQQVGREHRRGDRHDGRPFEGEAARRPPSATHVLGAGQHAHERQEHAEGHGGAEQARRGGDGARTVAP